jgi:hypothetical protein
MNTARFKEVLESLRLSHGTCDDCFYSCPMSDECCDDEAERKCNCGADAHNAKIDAAIKEIDEC